MNECESVIDQIQAVLNWDHDPDQEYMETLSSEYTKLVKDVNDRLRACDKLLGRGLRTEAIQQCETEPNLLDLTAILDFPEAEYWSDYVSQYELPPVPELLVSIAADLNDAYAAEQPVARLLKLHRLHALALSPLSDRIVILRELVDTDSDNAHWIEDLESYELARQTQIEEALEEAFQRKDTKAILEFDAELSDPSWKTRPPKSLRGRARAMSTRLRAYEARKQVKQLAEELNSAFQESDQVRTQECADRWEELAALAELPEDDPLLEVVRPALSWIAAQNNQAAGQKAWQDSVAALEKAIARDAPIQKLERLANTARQFEGGVPEELEELMDERFEKYNRDVARKKLLVTLAIVGGVLFFLVMVGLLAWVVLSPPEKQADDTSGLRRAVPIEAYVHQDRVAHSSSGTVNS